MVCGQGLLTNALSKAVTNILSNDLEGSELIEQG